MPPRRQDRPPSARILIADTERRDEESAAAARWAYGEYQSPVFDEVSVCVGAAVYSPWPLSREAPLDTYGASLFEFFGRERKKNGGHSWDCGLKISLRGLGQMFLGFCRVEVTGRGKQN